MRAMHTAPHQRAPVERHQLGRADVLDGRHEDRVAVFQILGDGRGDKNLEMHVPVGPQEGQDVHEGQHAERVACDGEIEPVYAWQDGEHAAIDRSSDQTHHWNLVA